MTTLDYALLVITFLVQAIIIVVKRHAVWKGVCGGNGIPQPHEMIRISAFLFMNMELAQIVFVHAAPDYSVLVFLGVIIGISELKQFKK